MFGLTRIAPKDSATQKHQQILLKDFNWSVIERKFVLKWP